MPGEKYFQAIKRFSAEKTVNVAIYFIYVAIQIGPTPEISCYFYWNI